MRKKALVVDNDFFFVEFLTELLEKRGYEVSKAYDGKEGITILHDGPYRFIFVDLVMPKIDGQQLIRYIRTACPDMGKCIVAVSGTLIERQDDIDIIGADCYLVKGPMEEMVECVEKVLDKFELDVTPAQTDRKVMEAGKAYPVQTTLELIDNLDFVWAIMENVGIGIMVLDLDAKVMIHNSVSLEIVQKPLIQVLNHVITDVLPLTGKRKMAEALKRIIQEPTLKRISFSASIQTTTVRIIVSSFSMKSKSVGWIIAMVPQ